MEMPSGDWIDSSGGLLSPPELTASGASEAKERKVPIAAAAAAAPTAEPKAALGETPTNFAPVAPKAAAEEAARAIVNAERGGSVTVASASTPSAPTPSCVLARGPA